jgi:uncharacterized lipoprotein YmbA
VKRLLVLLVVVGCGGSPPPQTHYYQLAAPTGGAGARGATTLIVEPLATDAGYDDERIVYRPSPVRLAYYDYHRWSAPPGELVAGYLERALERGGRFRVVRAPTSDASAILTGRVVAIEEVDESPTRWLGRLVIELVLTDVATGTALWSEQFEETEPLRVQSPEGLARALSTAMSRIVRRATPPLEAAVGAARTRQATR